MHQIRPVQQTGHVEVGEKQLDFAVGLEAAQRFVGIAGFENVISGMRKHVGCPQPLEHVVVVDQNQGLRRETGHVVTTSADHYRSVCIRPRMIYKPSSEGLTVPAYQSEQFYTDRRPV